MDKNESQTTGREGSADVAGSAQRYRLVLRFPLHDARTKWQDSKDFTKALKRAGELGVAAYIEARNSVDMRPPSKEKEAAV